MATSSGQMWPCPSSSYHTFSASKFRKANRDQRDIGFNISLLFSTFRLRDLVDVAKRLEGMARHASTLAAGVVISPVQLTDVLPVYKTNRGEITTQYDMDSLERLGLLKMDFLGLATLTVLSDAVKHVAASRGVQIDLNALPLDDATTYQLFARGDTNAIFQFESQGMRDILRRYQPTRLEDLTALNASTAPAPYRAAWWMISSTANMAGNKLPTTCRSCVTFWKKPTA